ncbi:MAG: class I SAM-dependent methyltransferase [Myxococcota bacterium]
MRQIPYRDLLQWFQADYAHSSSASDHEAPPPHLLEFYDRLGSFRGLKTVLDLGCGGGIHTIELARRGYHVTGIDIAGSQSLLDRVRQRSLDDHVEIVDGDITRDPFDQQSYDCVLCTRVLHLLSTEQLEAVAHKAKNALAPGGLIYLDILADIQRTFRDSGEEFTYTGLAEWSVRRANDLFTDLFSGWTILDRFTIHEEADWPIKPGNYPIAPYRCIAELVCVIAQSTAPLDPD